VSVLGLPIDFPLRAADRVLSDLHAIARLAAEMPARLDALDRRAEAILDLGERVVALGESINARADQMVALGEQIDSRGRDLVDLGEKLFVLGEGVNLQGVVIAERAREVADRGAEVAAALPMLQRAVGIAEPLEGAVERLGRMVDRFPGGRQRSGEPLPPPD
jgi:hypothetical protein